ncbi:MAG: phytanoyl-CoA dioxygenase family protein [Gemmatimonadetes bacterium]|jgi:ectoine hydroxylase-related dioxygenase (phytanoyl-CoA dioxygenase family)|nr:phytanoyl-CoA dioxygenase family protein [Gemmatimonadota bacterium]MBT6150197.1 phytanoyl-CoA dioxygenase family protein [Gemmatimonadota bacterium]MBT7863283.1 phytanoyl-CoA dioxygenase family protein [Gemmatimonadota bacterium]
MAFHVSDEQVQQFQRDGYLLVPNLYSAPEMDLLLQVAKSDMEKTQNVGGPVDAAGRVSKLWLTSDTERDDIYNAVCHGRRMVEAMDRLMEDEVYLYHYKMMVKEPRVGGAWEWHQDYGYWYNNGCLYPDMASCMIAVDRAYKGNGCLQVLRGSHKLGRIEHGKSGTQTGADPERVELASKHLEHVHCEMEPGSALFFHANLLHASAPNESDDPRWALICCYNTRHNPCEDRTGHPSYRPLEKWDDDRVLALGQQHLGS